MRRCLFLLLILIGFVAGSLAQEVTASPFSVVVSQPDGTSITIIGKGNRLLHWAETVDGYSIVRNSAKVYEYAVLDLKTGKLVPIGVKANDPNKRRRRERRFLRRKVAKHIKPLKQKTNCQRKIDTQ